MDFCECVYVDVLVRWEVCGGVKKFFDEEKVWMVVVCCFLVFVNLCNVVSGGLW